MEPPIVWNNHLLAVAIYGATPIVYNMYYLMETVKNIHKNVFVGAYII